MLFGFSKPCVGPTGMIAAAVVEAVHDEGEGLRSFDANVDGFAKNLVAALGGAGGEDLFSVDQDFHF